MFLLKIFYNIALSSKGNVKEHRPSWPEIPDQPHRILTVRGSGSGKTIALFNLINDELNSNKIYLYAKDA